MIEILSSSPIGCLVIHFKGKVPDEEYQQIRDAMELADILITKGKQVSLVIDLSNLEYFRDLEADREDLKVGFGEYNKVYRAAFVGSQKWIEWFTRLIGPFIQTEEKHFPEGQLEEACDWARIEDVS
jgi:hypothetical protein